MHTRTAGKLVLVAACTLYAYYTALVLITPFVAEGQFILRIFPRSIRHAALAVPVLAGVALFGVTLITLGCFLVASELGKLREQWNLKGKPKAE